MSNFTIRRALGSPAPSYDARVSVHKLVQPIPTATQNYCCSFKRRINQHNLLFIIPYCESLVQLKCLVCDVAQEY